MNSTTVIALGLVLVLAALYLEARAARRLQQTIAAMLADLSPHDRETALMPPPMAQHLRARAAEEPAPHGRSPIDAPPIASPPMAAPPPAPLARRSPILPMSPPLAFTPHSSTPKAPTFGPPPPSSPTPPSAGTRLRTQRPPAPELPPLTERRPAAPMAIEAQPDSSRTLLGMPIPPPPQASGHR